MAIETSLHGAPLRRRPAGRSYPAIEDAAPVSTARLWVGRALTGLPALFMLADGIGKVLLLQPVLEGSARLGYGSGTVFAIGVVEIICVALHLIPRTSVIGLLLLTAFLGGSTATHVRIGDPFYFPVMMGVLLWGGLVLRERGARRFLVR